MAQIASAWPGGAEAQVPASPALSPGFPFWRGTQFFPGKNHSESQHAGRVSIHNFITGQLKFCETVSQEQNPKQRRDTRQS